MSSKQKRKQARQNGAMAAGTKSPAAIQKSSVNALKHGLTSRAVVLSDESQMHFDELHFASVQEFEPESGVEMDLVDQRVSAQWRIRRIWRMQTACTRLHQRAMNSLAKLRKEKLRNDPEPTRPPASTSVNVNCETTPPSEPKPEIGPTGTPEEEPTGRGATYPTNPRTSTIGQQQASPDRLSTQDRLKSETRFQSAVN